MPSVHPANFQCQQCGACCRIPGRVRLLSTEIDALAQALQLDILTFTERYTTLASDRQGLVLTDHADGSCILLDATGHCTVHAVKPQQCRDFPFTWQNQNSVDYCPALSRALSTELHP